MMETLIYCILIISIFHLDHLKVAKMYHKLDLSRFLVCPDMELLGFRGVMKAGVGVMTQLCNIFSSHNIVLRQAYVSTLKDGKETMILAFVDITDSNAPTESILEELEKTGLFIELEVIRPRAEGFIADTVSHPLTAGKNRVILLRDLGYSGLLTEIRKLFGTGGEALLYHVGLTTGMGLAKLHREMADTVCINDPIDVFRKVSTAMFQWAGFGRIEVKELTTEHGEIVVHDSFECELGRSRAICYSQFVRGMLAGVLSELFGKGFNLEEEECIAKGDQVCKFKVRAILNKKQWGARQI